MVSSQFLNRLLLKSHELKMASISTISMWASVNRSDVIPGILSLIDLWPKFTSPNINDLFSPWIISMAILLYFYHFLSKYSPGTKENGPYGHTNLLVLQPNDHHASMGSVSHTYTLTFHSESTDPWFPSL